MISDGTLFCHNIGSFSVWVQAGSWKSGILGHKDLSKLHSFRESQCGLLGIPACRHSSKGLVHHLTALTCLLVFCTGVNVNRESFVHS